MVTTVTSTMATLMMGTNRQHSSYRNLLQQNQCLNHHALWTDKFGYPIDEIGFRIRSGTKRPPGMGPHTWALLDLAAKADEIQKWKK